MSSTYETIESVAKAYQTVYPEEIESFNDLVRFLNDLVSQPDHEVKQAVLQVSEDKKKRTQVHTIFRNCPFLPHIETVSKVSENTETSLPDKHVIIVTKVIKPAKRKAIGNPGGKIVRKKPWPGGKHCRYIQFVMEKINMDSNQALSSIARLLHVSQKLFSVAGTKDKRAVTSQFVTAYQIDPVRLQNLKNVFTGTLNFGNFEYCPDPLGLGDLNGNEFEIVLRGLKTKAGNSSTLQFDISDAVQKTISYGFINYFGLQRFGTGETSTHQVGEYLLHGKWKDAIDSILSPGNQANQQVQDALNSFHHDKDAEKASKMMPHKYSIQKSILEFLTKHGNREEQYSSALLALPKMSRNLYIHAFHSYVWNNVVSERIKIHGLNVLPGDLVLLSEKNTPVSRKRERHGGNGTKTMSDAIHIVEKEDIERSKYTLADVVMPLPGASVKYPQNSTAALYDKYVEKLAKTTFHNIQQFQYSSFPGDYRKIIFRPKDLLYKLCRYDDINEEIPCFGEIDERGQGKFLALALKFSLPPSTYATMLIREITKMPTDVNFAKSLDHSDSSQPVVN